MQQRIDEANYKIKEGEFEKAKTIFSELLDINPENPDYISGFYIASYWDNRLERILSSPEGKDRGLVLNSLFVEFETEFKNRRYITNSSYDAIIYCIVGESCSQLRTGFQKEGAYGFGKDNYLLLAKNLVRTEDYKNAFELMEFSKRFFELPAEYYFYKAECFYHLGDEKKSRILFRSTLLQYPDLFPFESIKSEPMSSSWLEISVKHNSLDIAREVLPVFCLEKNLLPEIADYSRDEINNMYHEVQRLIISEIKDDDLKLKVHCRIIQYCITILDSFHGQLNIDLSRKVREIIQSLDSGLLERREMIRRSTIKSSD
jgi:tetratricopeptide (TPR) repeat protein